MTQQQLIEENERLRIQIAKLEAEKRATLDALRKVQEAISLSNCKAMGLINVLQGTSR